MTNLGQDKHAMIPNMPPDKTPPSTYLVRHGAMRCYGEFTPSVGNTYRRGDRVVVRTDRGTETGEVLCPSTPAAMAAIPDRNKLTVQAADLSAVMDQIVKQSKDTYAFYPTPEYFRLVEQQSRAKGAGPAGAPAPVAPKR